MKSITTGCLCGLFCRMSLRWKIDIVLIAFFVVKDCPHLTISDGMQQQQTILFDRLLIQCR